MKYSVHTIESAPKASKETLQTIKGAMGFIPNMLGIFAEAPVVLDGSFALFASLGKGTLTAIEQQIVAITISRENNCQYCVAVHSTFAQHAKIAQSLLNAARSGQKLDDDKLEVLRLTTLKIIDKKGWLSAEDKDRFFGIGYTEAQLLEVVAWVGLKTLTNYINHITDTPVDEAFMPQKWEKS